jgi:peptidoglycan hydrolase-like protein with peptidoglycan-binding domain
VVVAVAAVVAVGAATSAATGFGLGAGLRGDDHSRPTGSGLPPETAKVTRQTLVDTQAESGELGYGDTTTLSSRLPGTITMLPGTGSTLKRGQATCRVDNTPVVLLYGLLPAYRTLATGTKGPDVKQFEQNLRALGYTGFTVDETYSASTATAVKEWQDALGLQKTGTVELGRVVYASGPVRVDTQTAAVGGMTQPGTAVLTYTGTSRVVTVELDVADQRLVRKGAAVTVTLPDGRTVPGKIAKALTVLKPAEGQNPATTKIAVTVTINDEKVLAGLDQAALQVAFTASERKDVLTVPVAALLALAEGGYGVQVVEGTATRILPVQTGLFASGRVEVSGNGLADGTTVGMPA